MTCKDAIRNSTWRRHVHSSTEDSVKTHSIVEEQRSTIGDSTFFHCQGNNEKDFHSSNLSKKEKRFINDRDMCVCVTWRREDRPTIHLCSRSVQKWCSIKSVNECKGEIDVLRLNIEMNRWHWIEIQIMKVESSMTFCWNRGGTINEGSRGIRISNGWSTFVRRGISFPCLSIQVNEIDRERFVFNEEEPNEGKGSNVD